MMLLLKETGLLRGTLNESAQSDLIVSPLFETIVDLRNAATIMRALYDIPGIAAMMKRSGMSGLSGRSKQDIMLRE